MVRPKEIQLLCIMLQRYWSIHKWKTGSFLNRYVTLKYLTTIAMRAVVDMYVHTGYIHVSECVTDGLYWQIGEFCVGNDWSLQQELCNKLLSIQKHFPHMGPWWISKSRTAFSQQRVQSNCIIIINQVKTKNNLYCFTLCFWNVISIALHPLTFN
jgi:hypothetical protein